MEKYADSIYSDGSQASQLLKNVVAGNAVAQPPVTSSAEYSVRDDYVSHASPQAVISQYRIQDLVVTQPHGDGTASPKNPVDGQIPVSSWEPPGLAHALVPSVSVVGHGQSSGVAEAGLVATGVNVARPGSQVCAPNAPVTPSVFPDASQRARATSNAQIPSPTPTPSPASPRGSKRRPARRRKQRSLSPVSDDSFAGPLPKDLAQKLFMAKSKAFQVPLSQLGRTQDSSIDDMGNRDELLSTASTDDLHGSPDDHSTARSSRILAPSSEPDDSQAENESFLGPQAQTVDDDYDPAQTQQSVWFPSSAEAELVVQQIREDHSNSPERNLPSTPEPTPPDDNLPISELSVEQTQPDDYISVSDIPMQQAGTSSAASAARSIMSLVDPRKVYRYKAVLEHAQLSSRPPLNSTWPQPTPAYSEGEETQPSTSSRLPATGHLRLRSRSPPAALSGDVEETQITSSANLPATGHFAPIINSSPTPTPPAIPSAISNLPPTASRIERELQQSPVSRPPINRRGIFSTLADYSDMDTIPDSEATPSDVIRGPTMSPVIPSPIPSLAIHPKRTTHSPPPLAEKPRSKPVPKSPSKPLFKIALSHSTSAEVVPDSIEEPNDATEDEACEDEGKKGKSAEKQEDEESSEEEGKRNDQPAEKGQEEECSGEESQPLAQVVAHRKQSGQAVAKLKRARGLSQTLMPPPPKKEKVAASIAMSTRARGRAALPGDAEENVPSSVPQENETKANAPRSVTRGKAAARKGNAKGKGKGKGKKLVNPKPVTPIRSHDGDMSDELSEVEGTVADDLRTELAEEDGMDVDDALPGPGPSTRKRKRMASAMPLRSSTKSSAKLTRPSTTTPGFRPTKRMKPESIEFIKRSGATRVFALWKDDNYFYSGTVHSEMAPNKYFIQFDDSTQAEVEIQSLRACEFKKGDYVYCISKDIDHQVQVVDASKGVSDEVVTVEDEMEEFDVYLSDIKVFGRTIEHQWDDRKLTANKIDPYEKPRPTQSSTPSSQSATSSSTGAGIARGRKMLSKMGFAVTLSNADGSTDLRRGLCRTIESHGGIIVDDWGKLFSMIGTHEAQGKRWLVRKHDVRWIKTKEDLHKVFLLADTSNQKPKFLMALALGIPCVKVDWLHDSVKANEKKQWQSYLLPTGTSERLHARISQLVDLNWGDCLEHLQHIMDNPVAIKIFANMNILCVSPDFVPEKAKKGSAGDMSSDADSKRMIPRIILCMGASTVEAVADTKYARAQNLADHYDYIVIEPDTYPDITSRLRRLENCVPFTWVKECLITGRILPIDDA